MTAAVTIEIGPRTAWVHGRHAVIIPGMKAARAPRQWDKQLRCWKVPAQFADDVVAAIELQFGGDVTVERVDR